uniref:Uncharacterized protein n=1 Tax=Opuntia streptacantha TaxID=393608 RepID=A0A7C9CAQ6_OPUST
MWRTTGREVIAASTSSSFSLLHYRSITCAVSRLAPHPPDLVKWVRREGGFVHQAVTIAHVPPHGLGLVAAHEIPRGSDLIGLPPHIPLKFDSGSSSALASLVQRVPG